MAHNLRTNQEKVKSWRWRRTKAGLSLEGIAKATGKKVPQLSNYETGKVEPKASTIDVIEDFLRKHGV
jgi:transcriptional regulator with XRE-family HTH domain